MNYPPLTITFPDMSGEVAANLQTLLYALTDAFDFHYHRKIEQYYRQSFRDHELLVPNENQDPF